jgi:hypothetical protein
MNFNFTEAVSALDPRRKLIFYELFAHHLTVVTRGVLFFEGIADKERIERAKWLNEIAHRVTFNVFALGKGAPEFTDADILEMIGQNVRKDPRIEADVEIALENSYGYVIRNESDSAEEAAAAESSPAINS